MAETRDETPGRGRYWKPLDLDRGYPEMARYVSVGTLDRFALSVERPDVDPDALDQAVVEGLFELLQGRRYRFREEDWVPRGEGGQRIRHVALIASEGGNCADLSTTFAAMCLRSKVAPLLAVTGDDSHAFVIARHGWFLAHRGEEVAFEIYGAERDDIGVVRVEKPDGVLAAIERGELIPVDCVAATDPVIDFQEASKRCSQYIESGLHIIDIAYLHDKKKVQPEESPDDTAIILRYPPVAKTKVKLFAAQEKTAQEIARGGGKVLAIIADPGQGKSTVGRWLVDHAANDSGWFLNASDPQALIDSLADAEITQAGLSRSELERPDREGYALAAKRRLEANPAPWIAVLDNADGDPKPLLKYLPRPGTGQLVLITSTNDAWQRYIGRGKLGLDKVTPREVTRQLGGRELRALVGGRALMVHAFGQLLRTEQIEPSQVAAHAPAPGRMPKELEGPSVLWRVLSERGWFKRQHLWLCAIAAHLPPDHLPIDLLEELAGARAGALLQLAERGLFTAEPGAARARLHRLFGLAIRWNLEHDVAAAKRRTNLLESVALAIATSGQACKLLGDHGDLKGVKLLLGRVEQARKRGVAGPVLRDALRNLGTVLELRGDTAASADAYELLVPLLTDGAADRRILAERHHAQARVAYRNYKKDEPRLRDGLEHAAAAHAIATELNDEDNVGRYLAMQGLVLKELAAFPRPGESSLKLSVEALKLLEQAHEIRDHRLGDTKETHPEWARSYFNLAGARLPLAQGQPRQAKKHLDRAAEIYREVAALRRVLFSTDVHAQIAPCIQGLGLVAYYRALLVADDEADRSRQLREATHRLAEALAQWEELEGPQDGAEAAKVSGYLFKVALARKAHPSLAYKPHPERGSAPNLAGWAAPLVTEAVQELAIRHEIS